MKKDKRRWTQDEVDYLRSNWHLVSSSTIAAVIERTVEAVQKKVTALGLDAGRRLGTGTMWTVAEEQTLRQMWSDGAPLFQIAKALKRSSRSVGHKRHSMQLPTRRVKPLDMRLVRRLLDEKLQYSEMLERIEAAGGPRLTKQQLGNRIRAAGWHGTGGTRPRGSTWGSLVSMGVLRRSGAGDSKG